MKTENTVTTEHHKDTLNVGWENLNILLIGENQDTLFKLKNVIERYFPKGCEIQTTTVSDDALELAATGQLDAILLDMEVDADSAIDTCKGLPSSIPVVMVTNSQTEPGQKARALEAGAVDFINSSIDNSEFIARIKVMLRLHRAEKEKHKHDLNIQDKILSILADNGDLDGLSLKDVINIHEIQTLMGDFYKLTKIGVALVDAQGQVLVATGWQQICTNFHRLHPDAQKHCLESDTALSREVKPGEFKLYKCKNHLWDMATPIVIGNKTIGNLFLGQFFFEDEVPDYDIFRKQARRYGFDEKEYLAALDEVPRWSRETVNTAMSFYARLATIISKLSCTNVELATALNKHNQTAEALQKSESILTRTQQLSKVGGWEWDIQKQTLYWTDETYRIYGMKPEEDITGPELLQKGLSCCCPKNRELLLEKFRRCVEFGEPYDMDIKFKNTAGREMWVRTTAEAVWKDDKIIKVIGNIMDITESKTIEQNLEKQLNLHQRLMEAIPTPVFYKDVEGKYIDCNEAFEIFFATKRENIIGKTVYDISPRKLADEYYAKDVELFLSPGIQIYEGQIKNQNGELKDVLFHKATFTNQTGEVAGLIGVILDITKRKQIENALIDSEEKYRELFENLTSGVAVWDITEDGSDFILLDINPTGEKLSCVKKEDVIGKKAAEGFPGIKEMGLWDVLHEVWKTGLTKQHPASLYQDGKLTKWYENSVFKLPNGQLIAVYKDITERKQLEKQYFQAQKMEAVGQLAGGIAHDFRNQLTVVLGYAEMLRRKGLVQERDLAKVDAILQAVDRSVKLTSQLLAFSRKQTLQPQVVNISETVSKLSATLPQLLGEDIKLNIVTGRPPHYSLIDENHFEQALINLVLNARDAMAKGGELTIETSCIELAPVASEKLWGLKPGSYVRVKVSDTGTGMDEETRNRIFEPFFTTKDEGKGSGLGLAMVFGFVKQSGGSIDVHSIEGVGTTFRLFFPTTDIQEDKMATASPTDMMTRGQETILVVEDEDAVRLLLTDSLKEVGYRVLDASSVAEALKVSLEYEGKIDLLLTDIIMPSLTGVELSEQILKKRPETKVLYISGYAKKALSSKGVDPSKLTLLTKPVEHSELIQTVQKLLQTIIK